MSELTTEVSPETGEETTVVPEETLNPDQLLALTFIQGLCAASGLGAQAVVRSAQKPYLQIEIVGEDVRQTWGRQGQTLDALQFLCNTVLAHRVSSDVRLMLDAEGYRARRAATLIERARELAREVRERNQEAELEPLPAHERRIIHNALIDEPGITTYSEGDEPSRHIVIAPRAE
jgi:spoIIIJ-associated protein